MFTPLCSSSPLVYYSQLISPVCVGCATVTYTILYHVVCTQTDLIIVNWLSMDCLQWWRPGILLTTLTIPQSLEWVMADTGDCFAIAVILEGIPFIHRSFNTLQHFCNYVYTCTLVSNLTSHGVLNDAYMCHNMLQEAAEFLSWSFQCCCFFLLYFMSCW